MEDTMKPKAILYTRVSSESQVENTSLDQQENFGKDFCNRNNFNLVKVFKEEGESAKFIDRTMLRKSIAYCTDKKNKIEYFVVYKFDRFSRNVENHIAIKATLAKYGVRLMSVTEPIDDSPSGRFFETILAAVAQFDNEVRTERTISGMTARMNQGYWLWDAPTGYVRNKETKLIDPHPVFFKPLQEAWGMLLSGRYGRGEILEFLRPYGIRTNRDKPFDRKRLSEMFRNPFYAGLVYSNGLNIRAKGKHQPMISELEFNLALEIFDNKSKNQTGKLEVNPEFTLAKTLHCTGCGYLLSGCHSKGKNKYYAYYQCGRNECKERQILGKDVVESAFLHLLESLVPPKHYLELFNEIASDVYSVQYENKVELGLEKKSRIVKVQAKLSKLKDLLEDGIYQSDEYIERKARLESELLSLEVESSEAMIDAKEMETCINYITKFIEHLPTFWHNLSGKERAKFNQILFPSGLYFENGAYRTPELEPGLQVIVNFSDDQEFENSSELIKMPPRGLEPLSAR
jgi:site-specific DNA recombinase